MAKRLKGRGEGAMMIELINEVIIYPRNVVMIWSFLKFNSVSRYGVKMIESRRES